MSLSPELKQVIEKNVKAALEEDIGTGDITALLIPEGTTATATIITREDAVLCGQPWVDEVFRQLDESIEIDWLVEEGNDISPDQTLCRLKGPARSLLTGERTALNFLQTLSGTATISRQFAKLVEGSETRILDTRKTIPGLRLAQKYAVKIGGCSNHRIGLYDAFLIKENHIAACGSIKAAVEKAREVSPGKPVEVEVENLEELNQAVDAAADIIMLDNFTPEETLQAIKLNQGKAKLEVSGNVTLESFGFPPQGISFISTGQMTKSLKAVDLSMRIVT